MTSTSLIIFMKDEKKYKYLKAIKSNSPFSKNNRDMAYLSANGYTECVGVENTSYVKAKITLTGWGEAWIAFREKI